MHRFALPVLLIFSSLVGAAPLQTGTVEHHEVHGAALENNVTGEETRRNVAVYLPPGYDASSEDRYPVLYLLHGIMDTEVVWTRPWYDPDDPWGTVARLMDRGIAAGRLTANLDRVGFGDRIFARQCIQQLLLTVAGDACDSQNLTGEDFEFNLLQIGTERIISSARQAIQT